MKTLKPILYSTPMVQAILDGRKTQTRRIVKDATKSQFQVGDILWVRETWKLGAWDHEDATAAFDYKASPELKKTEWVDYEDLDRFEKLMESGIEELDKLGIEPIVNEDEEKLEWKWEPGQSPFKWKPSIHMPFEAARIFTRVTEKRIERLQDIIEQDATAEGVENTFPQGSIYHDPYDFKNYTWHGDGGDDSFSGYSSTKNARESFQSLWYKIYGKQSWDENPSVWVYKFERVEKP